MDRIGAYRKPDKEQIFTEKYEADLAALRINSPSPPPGPLSSPFSVKAQGILKSQSPPRVADLRSSFHVLSSDLDLDVVKICSRRVRKLPSPTFDTPEEARLSGDACEESPTGGEST